MNGMRIVQLFAPNDNPNYLGFSPRPTPKLIATYRTTRSGAGGFEGHRSRSRGG